MLEAGGYHSATPMGRSSRGHQARKLYQLTDYEASLKILQAHSAQGRPGL
jgi:hypothetical protein